MYLYKYFMNIHRIHDLSNKFAVSLLENHFEKEKDENIIQNYHPDYRTVPGNIFYILDNGRYAQGKGTYFVIEDGNEYICSAGWNEYELDRTIALILTRMYVVREYRTQYLCGEHILPICIEESKSYGKCWITCNEYNKAIYNWFVRKHQGKKAAMFSDWPEIYNNFEPIGTKTVYFTEQYVAQLKRKI